jgi:hypothetical protein
VTDIKNYKDIVRNVFSADIDIPDSEATNNCIGALNNRDNFGVFTDNFISRLKRLQSYFKDDSGTLGNILLTLKAIGLTKGYKWSGPYSELVTLDYWIQFENLEELKYVDRGPVATFEESLAKRIGQKEVDIDISFNISFSKVFMDVKSLIPTHLELVDQILDAVRVRTTGEDYLIAIDDLFEVDYLRTKKDYIEELRSGTLVDELEKCIRGKKISYEHTLPSGTKAKFRIAYTGTGTNTVLTSMRSMDPYRLASDYKYKVLDYYNKLLINKPSFITLVSNPWFNKEMSDFAGFDDTFYRSFARRVFMELTKNNDDMGNYYTDLSGKNLKICDVAKLISGIIFIGDHSILETGDKQYRVYIFTNPNATNKSLGKYDFDIFRWSHFAVQPKMIEDFRNDNY